MRTISHYKTYGTYLFKTKDPIIDALRTKVQDAGAKYSHIAELSGVSASTIWNWFHGDTLRPQFASVMAVARSLGYDLQLVRQDRRPSAGIITRRSLNGHARARAALPPPRPPREQRRAA